MKKKQGKENLFCKKCSLEINHNDQESIEYHKDACGISSVVPRSEVKIEGNDKDYNNKDERSSSKILHDFVMSKIRKLVISENNSDEVYAVVSINNHVEVLNLASIRARQWLSYEYSKNIDSNEIHSDDFFKNVLHSITSNAQMNGTGKAKVYNRIAHLDDSIWYDLGTPNWKAIKITKDGVKTVSLDEHSPLFRRSQSMSPQFMPKNGKQDYLEKLADLLRILPEDRIVFKIHLVSLFLEAYPVPMIVFDGSAGSIKTTATAAIKSIVDPNGHSKEDNVSTMAEKLDDLIIQLYNRYMSSFDNVSRIDDKTSDVLCRAITGSSNPKRRLYTDGDEAIHSFKRKIILNGIIPTLEYPDLQTRIINYSRMEINESNRLTEKEFQEKFSKLIPYVLGQTFIILSKTLKKLSENKSSIRPRERMADFEVWGETISQVLGHEKTEFLERYYEKLKEEKLESQDAYPIISAMLTFMDKRNFYEDTASNLHAELSETAEDLGIDLKTRFVRFPKSSNKLVKHLRMVEPFLKTSGIIVESYHYTKNDGKFTKHASVVRITKKPDQSSLESFRNVSSPSSPPSPGHDLGTKTGEDTGEDTAHQNTVPSPKMAESRHEIPSGEDGEGSEGTFCKVSSQKYFICWTCNNKGTEPMPVSEVSPNGLTAESHERAGHYVQYLTPSEAKLVRDYYINGGLKPDILERL